MKIQTSIKKRSSDDIIVRRRGVLFRINKKNPRNKARQPLAKPARKASYVTRKRKVAKLSRKRKTGSKF